jgi:hypothetical protein
LPRDGCGIEHFVLEGFVARRHRIARSASPRRYLAQASKLMAGIFVVHPAVVGNLCRRIRKVVFLLEIEPRAA